MHPSRLFVGAAAVSLAASAGHASVIVDWNNHLLDAIRQAPAGPPSMGRNGAMVMTAMYNAVNAVDQTHFSYGGFNVQASAGTSRQAAAAQAAHDVMVNLYPAQSALWNARLNDSLSAIADGPAKLAGITLGQQSAAHMIGLRSADGMPGTTFYPSGMQPGDYRNPNNPGNPNFGADVNGGNFQTWGITSGAQFRPSRLSNYGTMANFLASQEYADNFNDVKNNGRIDRWTPADEEYQIAFFWANDRNGTYKPPGHLNAITQTMADRAFAGMNPDERLSKEARLFALLNIAMADAGVAAWDCKYNSEFDLWRPVTGIQLADTDGNPATVSDPTWEPLNHVDPDGPGPLLADPFTPPFPAYVSGHATFGAAHSAIMREFFGDSDQILGGPLTIGSEDPYNGGITRTFDSWEAMARENGRSRVYLGVHWQIDADDGYTMGDQVGQWIFDRYLREVPAPGSAVLAFAGGLLFARRRRPA
ncbi:MAG: vanadium-dependent haloperoxidase [Planctomycetota bacterium]|nr:vanadium-dependent haloperoxidase [Planctomycetota bacterium]